MYSIIKFLGTVFVLLHLTLYCQGLKCYTCAHFEEGKIDGLNLSDTCKWGQKPDDKYLQECLSTEDNSKGNIYDFTCTEIKITGKFLGEGYPSITSFIGTIRDCAARLTGTKNKNVSEIKGNGNVFQNNKLCKQGKLHTVMNSFEEDPIGFERLEQYASMFEPNATTVKFCTCKDNGCWEQRENVPEVTDENGKNIGYKVSGMSILSQLVIILSLLTLLQ